MSDVAEGASTKRTRKPTQRDVANTAGASQAAVSRVFVGRGYVAKDVRERVLAAAEALGYRPDALASALASGTSNIIALLVAGVSNPFYPEVIQRLTSRLQSGGAEVLIFHAASDDEIDSLVPSVLKYRVRGAIVATAATNSNAASQLVSHGIPTVQFNRYAQNCEAPAVTCDNFAGGKEIAIHFAELGRKRFAYIGGDPSASTDIDRRHGFEAGAASSGLRVAAAMSDSFTYEWGREATMRLLTADPHIDAIFCGDDVIAFGVIDALRYDLGKQVPADIAVAGFDDVPSAAWTSYGLTTLRQPVDRMIEATLELLVKNSASDAFSQTIAGELIRRTSTIGQDINSPRIF